MVNKYIVFRWLERKRDNLAPDCFGHIVDGLAYATIEEATAAAEKLKKAVDAGMLEGTTMNYEIKNIYYCE